MEKSVILFDGVCNFCNASVNFIIERDKKDNFRFSSLQSEKGKDILLKFGLDSSIITTLILVEDKRFFCKSDAALRIAGKLKFPWNLFKLFLLVPTFIRNPFYDFIASNRYKWFGRRNTCRVPTEAERVKFL